MDVNVGIGAILERKGLKISERGVGIGAWLDGYVHGVYRKV